jgi:hypothetical protein
MQAFMELGWTTKLARGEPEALESLAALTTANAWLEDHEDLFAAVEPIAKTAVVLPAYDPVTPLVRAGKSFVVLQPKHLTSAQLSQFELVVLRDVRFMSDRQVQAVLAYVEAGGRLIATGQTSYYEDRLLTLRPTPGLKPLLGETGAGRETREKEFGKGRGIYCSGDNAIADVLAAWNRLEGKPLVAVAADGGVVGFNVARSRDGRRTLVYLMNYAETPASEVCLTLNLPRPVHRVRRHAPGAEAVELETSSDPQGRSVKAGALDSFAVVEIE